jgi:hypothetical protein
MSAVVTPPPKLAVPPITGWKPYRWSVQEYRELGRFFPFEGVKVMLLDREIYTMVYPNATAYRTHLTFGPNDTVAPLAAPTATVKVADLLP